jgi:undecaprenyl-diphosphatase
VDFELFEVLNGFAAHHDGFEDVMRLVAMDAHYLFVALLAVLFLARGKWRSINARRAAVAAGFSAALALGIAQAISHLWERPRPYVAHPSEAHLFIPSSFDPSFPSDHATAAFAIAVAIWLRHRAAGSIALAMATVLSIARVAVGTHYPGDVLGGAVIGAIAAWILWNPLIRRPLHGLAERAGGIYDSLAEGALRRRGSFAR